MASKPVLKPVAKQATKAPTYSYRAERTDSYSWQAYKVINVNGTSTEEAVFKPDLFEIVMQKISQAIRSEGQVTFIADKKKREA